MELNEKYLLSVAHALYITRLHVLTLTEVVRNKIEPDEDGLLRLPPRLDEEMKNQAFDYLLATFPPEFHPSLLAAREQWMVQQ